MVSGVPKEGTLMQNTKKKATNAKLALDRPTTTATVATGVRAKAARRTAEGKFTKIIFNQIGGKECRRFAAMTWKERAHGVRYGVKPLFTLGHVVGILAVPSKRRSRQSDRGRICPRSQRD
jgi:hypothetical protein